MIRYEVYYPFSAQIHKNLYFRIWLYTICPNTAQLIPKCLWLFQYISKQSDAQLPLKQRVLYIILT